MTAELLAVALPAGAALLGGLFAFLEVFERCEPHVPAKREERIATGLTHRYVASLALGLGPTWAIFGANAFAGIVAWHFMYGEAMRTPVLDLPTLLKVVGAAVGARFALTGYLMTLARSSHGDKRRTQVGMSALEGRLWNWFDKTLQSHLEEREAEMLGAPGALLGRSRTTPRGASTQADPVRKGGRTNRRLLEDHSAPVQTDGGVTRPLGAEFVFPRPAPSRVKAALSAESSPSSRKNND